MTIDKDLVELFDREPLAKMIFDLVRDGIEKTYAGGYEHWRSVAIGCLRGDVKDLKSFRIYDDSASPYFTERCVRQLMEIAIDEYNDTGDNSELIADRVMRATKKMIASGNLVGGVIVSDKERDCAHE